jgi:hypothetical protein
LSPISYNNCLKPATTFAVVHRFIHGWTESQLSRPGNGQIGSNVSDVEI